ncbi:MAG TPA: phage integrase N-terminal SAM-like domain-containing protein, partial [Acidimicrobiales bacterium]|nr:phage integrase N-terminal SAM-like domain-containing protein [Acidimicrobiales bacterium]
MPKAVPLDIEALDTLADTEAEFVQSLRVKNRSPRTIETYLEAIHLLDAFLAERGHSRAVRDVTAADIEAFQLAELARLKPSSVAVRFRSLRAYWNWCARARGLSRSPMADIGAPKVQESVIDVVSFDEIGALLKVTRADKTFSGYRDTAL